VTVLVDFHREIRENLGKPTEVLDPRQALPG